MHHKITITNRTNPTPLTLTSPTLPLTLPGQTSHICIVC